MWKMATKFVLNRVPWETVVAWAFNWLIKKYRSNPDKHEGVLKTSQKCLESVIVVNEILAIETGKIKTGLKVFDDGKVTSAEAKQMMEETLEAWADAKKTPTVFKKIWELDTVEPIKKKTKK